MRDPLRAAKFRDTVATTGRCQPRGAGWLIATPAQIVEELGRREEAGLTRVMPQHLAIDAHDTLELVASEVLPQVRR